jgi:hypothetical protein
LSLSYPVLEPASSALHRNDEPGFRKPTSSYKFFQALDANGRFQCRAG